MTAQQRVEGWLDRSIILEPSSDDAEGGKIYVAIADIMAALKHYAPKPCSVLEEKALKAVVKDWFSRKGAEFKGSARVDVSLVRTCSQSEVKKSNIFIGAKLKEMPTIEEAEGTLAVVFESPLLTKILETVGWKTIDDTAKKVQAGLKNMLAAKKLRIAAVRELNRRRMIRDKTERAYEPDPVADAAHSKIVAVIKRTRSDEKREERRAFSAWDGSAAVALMRSQRELFGQSLLPLRPENQEAPDGLSAMLPTPNQASGPVPTPAAYDAGAQLEPPPGPGTVQRFAAGNIREIPLLQGVELLDNGEWRDHEGRVLYSPQLIGAWPSGFESTPFKLRVYTRFNELPVESPPVESPASSPEPTQEQINQAAFESDCAFVRRSFTYEEIPNCGLLLLLPKAHELMKQWKLDLNCPFVSIVAQVIRRWAPDLFVQSFTEKDYETPAQRRQA